MRVFEIEGAKIRIDCDYWESRLNWGHKAPLFVHGVKTGPTKYTTYYNRTWERWTFESVLSRLLDRTKDLTDGQKKQFVEKYSIGD